MGLVGPCIRPHISRRLFGQGFTPAAGSAPEDTARRSRTTGTRQAVTLRSVHALIARCRAALHLAAIFISAPAGLEFVRPGDPHRARPRRIPSHQ